MARAVLVALLVGCVLVGSTIGSAAVSQPSSLGQLDDDRPPDVEMLGPGSPTQSDVTTPGVDVSTAVAIQREEVDAAIDRRALGIAFERTDDEQERRELLFEAATDVEIAISSLRSNQRDVRADYVNGTIPPGAYVRSRALASARAEQLREDLELIGRTADSVPQLSMRSRLEALEVSLTGVGGPATERLEATIAGEDASVETYVAVSSNGRVLAMISGGEYVREAYRTDAWTPDSTSGFGFDEAVARANELYPVAFNSSRNLGRGVGEHGAGTYQISMEVAEGDVVTYLDGDTGNVFYEVQRFDLGSIEPGPSVSASDNGTRLAVNRTHDGGPLRVATYDNTTGAPIDVTVAVGDSRYTTGPDGVVWALNPDGRTGVVATGPGGNVSVTASPLTPSLIDVDPVEEGSAGRIEATPRGRSTPRSTGQDVEGSDRDRDDPAEP